MQLLPMLWRVLYLQLSLLQLSLMQFPLKLNNVGRIMLPHTNPEGSNGNSCGEFVANEANVAFSILSAPATESYNVQLYHGTASSGGIPVYLYAKDVPIGS